MDKLWIGISMSDLKAAVCEAACISEEDMMGGERYRDLTKARTIFCYYAFKHLHKTTFAIGKEINRDHVTVIYHRKKYHDEMRYADFATLDRDVNKLIQARLVAQETGSEKQTELTVQS